MIMKLEKIKNSSKRRKLFYCNKYEETNKYIYATRRLKIFYIKSFYSKRRWQFYYKRYERTWDFYIHEDTFERNFIFGWTFFFINVLTIILLGGIEVLYGINYIFDDLCYPNEFLFLYDFNNNYDNNSFNNFKSITYHNIIIPIILLCSFSIIFIVFLLIIL
jgi:hypothetical protein